MNIEHLVISSGTYRGIKTLGSIKYLLNNKHILIENIKSIHSTSAGSIIGLILCLKIDINDIVKYVINKPWNNNKNPRAIKIYIKDMYSINTIYI